MLCCEETVELAKTPLGLYLDENKQLILAILDNQNLGKLSECAQYQAQLQKNLLYLAAIADAQSQSPSARPQMMPQGPIMPPQGSAYMQQAQIFPPRAPLQFNPQQIQEQQLHPPPNVMPFPPHMAMRPNNAINGIHAMHADPSHGGSSGSELQPPAGMGNKPEAAGGSSEPPASAGGESHRSSGGESESGSGDAKLREKA
ncbi:GRF1-interacting factor 3-like isoform X2 [Ananas comosus]|uniref:GRF1-interacting factor 3-like isoform X2 n=1 Tax=Ananas comosus TaxID=4615 RepID=A0A6P5G5X4_ANACO|nr:GRF1-interacting factor 3-like isoform X2 [Ananas comosus]